uniref:Uncharacterized protein n=1 Tax=Opuntia streptacantha TaxID=393608 RepID=A0A7C9E9C7_OPUST
MSFARRKENIKPMKTDCKTCCQSPPILKVSLNLTLTLNLLNPTKFFGGKSDLKFNGTIRNAPIQVPGNVIDCEVDQKEGRNGILIQIREWERQQRANGKK